MNHQDGRVFVYGSLLDPACLAAVLGQLHRGERLRARLAGYRRVELADYGYPFIVADAGGVVDGLLLEGLTADELRRLDDYEECDQGMYRRVRVEVEAWTCGPRPLRLSAWTYVGGPHLAHRASLEPASATRPHG